MKKIFLLLTCSWFFLDSIAQLPDSFVLKGTIVTPHEILPGGLVFIENGKITGVHRKEEQVLIPKNVLFVDTKGIIFPGLVDLHNHISWNVIPPWEHGNTKFVNRYVWRNNSVDFKDKVNNPYDGVSESPYYGDSDYSSYCEMNTYGEIRGLIGGTTSMVNTAFDYCINGLIRNLDDPGQVDNKQIECRVDLINQNPDNEKVFQSDLGTIKSKLMSGSLDAFLIHLAEGRASDKQSKGEFKLLVNNGLLTNKTIIVHGIALGHAEFKAMKSAGSSLVWSPQSNIDLYGQTTDIITAKHMGIKIALAPDWAISGGENMLDELNFAAAWNKDHLKNLFTDQDLVEMVTSIPASMTGLSHKIGSITVGSFADLLVITGDSLHPYTSLVNGHVGMVKLVLVNGSPMYGKKDLMEIFWNPNELEQLPTSLATVLKLPLPLFSWNSFKELSEDLTKKLVNEGTTLAPLLPELDFIKPDLNIKTKPAIIKPNDHKLR